MNRKVHAGFGPADGGSTARKLVASAPSDWHLLFADDKRTLHRWRQQIIQFLATLRLTLHEGRAQVYPVRTGIPFLGFRIYPERRRLKLANGYAFRRRFRRSIAAYRAGTIDGEQLQASVQGWANHARYGNTVGLRKAILCTMEIKPPKPLDLALIP